MIQLQKNVNVTSMLSALVVGIFVFLVFSYLLIPAKITLPLSIIMSILSFGLALYYHTPYKNALCTNNDNSSFSSSKNRFLDRNKKNKENISNFLFTLVYSVTLLISVLSAGPNLDTIFISWNIIEITDLIKLGAGILLTFFIPGYAVVLLLCKKYEINNLCKILLAFLSSVLINALTTYASAIYLENDILETKTQLIGVYFAILIVFIVYHRLYRLFTEKRTTWYSISYSGLSDNSNKLLRTLKSNVAWSIVFGSLFALLILSTYYLYGGITIGDQWDHQGRALLFLSNHFRENALPNSGELVYTPFLGALLAGLTTLSGTPLVNTYASIAFLNMAAVLAFYFFCREWFPLRMRRAALLAATLFVLSGGFGWIDLLYSTGDNPATSQISSISNFVQGHVKFSDIILSANFMIAAFPDFSTGLILVALPAGFLLLGLVRLKIKYKFSYIALVSIISLVGTLFHDEFHIFIIISSMLPLVFNLKNRDSLYFAFLVTFGCVYILDIISPIKYFTSTEIFGTRLFNLNIIFVVGTWALYIVRQKFNIQSVFSSPLLKTRIRTLHSTERIKIVSKIILVWMVAYFTALSFIVWAELPPSYLQANTANYNNPWYLYPVRLGLVGLFGISYILSYLFKKFEKELFVFGIIIIVALITGPYYNEHRFTKYIMAGMIGFTSLLIFNLLCFLAKRYPIANSVTLSSIVMFSSLSALLFIGYNALVLETQDYSNALGKRNFPSAQEMNLLEFMRSKIHDDSNTHNVASLSNEYGYREGGIITKLRSFSGLPYTKIIQSPLTLNATTLDTFYHLLDVSNTKYIVISHNSIKDRPLLPGPTQFALDYFQPVYNDNQYLVLKVPRLDGPSTDSKNDTAIISKEARQMSPALVNSKYLRINNATFDLTNKEIDFANVKTDIQIQNKTFMGGKKTGEKTLWSKNITENGINYIETRLRTIEVDKSGNDSVGIKWIEGPEEYAVYFSDAGLELRQSSQIDRTISLSKNTEIDNKKGIWYNLKIQSLDGSINVYLDDTPKLRAKKTSSENHGNGISKIGIVSGERAFELESMLIRKIPRAESNYTEKNESNAYFPISSLALSGGNYEVFSDDDYSVFSKKQIIIPFDPTSWNVTKFNKYVEYARSGGSLVVMNSNDDFNGMFIKLFSKPNGNMSNNFTQFSTIETNSNQSNFLNVSGNVKNIVINSSDDANTLASYLNKDNEVVAPFIIEKIFPSKGKIILVNSMGYFDAIKKNPKEYFPSLSNFSKLFDINYEKRINQNITGPINRFLGQVKISGNTLLNGSSLLFPDISSDSYPISVGNVSILDKNGALKNSFKKASILSIKLLGQYNIFISTNDKLTLPSPISQSEYIGALLPKGFNMTVNLSKDNNSSVEIITKDGSYNKNTIVVNNESKIAFYNVKSNMASSRALSVLMKNPEITVVGNMSFNDANFYGRGPNSYISLKMDGEINAEFDFVDEYDQPYDNGTRTRYVTYLKSINFDGTIKKDINLKLPGEIPSNAKNQGLYIPLEHILISPANIIILIVLTSITTIISKLIWNKMKYHRKS